MCVVLRFLWWSTLSLLQDRECSLMLLPCILSVLNYSCTLILLTTIKVHRCVIKSWLCFCWVSYLRLCSRLHYSRCSYTELSMIKSLHQLFSWVLHLVISSYYSNHLLLLKRLFLPGHHLLVTGLIYSVWWYLLSGHSHVHNLRSGYVVITSLLDVCRYSSKSLFRSLVLLRRLRITFRLKL